MNKKDLDALNELYSSVYSDPEQLNEYAGSNSTSPNAQDLSNQRQATLKRTGGVLGAGGGQAAMKALQAKGVSPRSAYAQVYSQGEKNLDNPKPAVAKPAVPKPAVPKPAVTPAASTTRPASAPATRPTASTSPGTPKVAPTKPTGSPMDQWRAANPKLAAAADEKARIRGTQQTDNPLMKDMRSKLPMNSPSVQSPAVAKLGAGNQSLVNNPNAIKAAPPKPAAPTPSPAPARNGFGASTAPMAAKSSVSSATAPAKPAKPTEAPKRETQLFSYQWPSAKTIREIAGAYASIYEAKKKVDQDQDGDNDFADVRVARMIASGVPKAKAIAMVKDKSYNEEVELWVNDLLEEGYDLSEYTWEDMFEIYEATAMAKRGYDETKIRNKIAKSTGGGEAADRATELENRPTFGNKTKQASREKLARTQRGDFRRTTSSDYGLRLGAHKSDDPAVKAKQAARGKQRSALTPREKKMLNREAYETYEFVASYLLENNFATTVDDANVIINNMSEGWFNQIIEG